MSKFKAAVYKIIQSIPKGKVVSYGQVAVMAGVPRAARQVGWLLMTSGEEDNLPWWRVINNAGRISIKNPECPQEVQRGLLIKDGVEVTTDKNTQTYKIDMEKYRYLPSRELLKKLSLRDEEVYKIITKYNR